MRNPLCLLAAVLACLLLPAAAKASCVPISQPYRISAPGSYCVTAALVAPSDGITINADNVDLDCGGYTIDGTAQLPSSTKRGVVGYSRKNVVVRNCRIKGFIEGVRLTGTGNSIRDNVMIAPLSRGIVMVGDNNTVDGNRVSDVGGSTNYSWGAFGIFVTGPSIIRDNVVSGVVPTQGSYKSGYGIYTSGNDSGLIQGNTVRNVLGDGGQIGMALTAYESSSAILKENILINPVGSYSFAIYCTGDDSYSTGNIFQGFANGLSPACTAITAE